MKDLRSSFDRWLRLSRGPPSEGRGRRGYQVARLLRRRGEESFGWVSYWLPERHAFHPVDLDLWSLHSAPAGAVAYHRVCRDLEFVNCVYDQVLERIYAGGRVPRRRLLLRANLVSPTVKPDPSLALASLTGFRIRLWTYGVERGAFAALPYCEAPAGPPKGDPGPLDRLLRSLATRV